MRRRNWLLCATVLLAGFEPPGIAAQPQDVIVVGTAADLQAALTLENAGRRIRVLSGTYPVSGPLVVPDGVALEGEGVMTGADLPDGFEVGTETRIVPDPAALPFSGDLLTLGHGVTIRGLIVEDVAGRPGNVVAVRSRAPGDRVSASVIRCEIVNPKPSGAGPDGPLGRALVVLTQNRLFAADPPPDEGAMVSVLLTHSIVRSTSGGSAIFANNFAARGDVTIVARSNRIFGSLEVDGGVSRPDEVKDARLTVESDGNVYSPLNETGAGQPQSLGTENELRILGSPNSFGVLNPGIDPAPPAEFFNGLDH